MQGVAGVLSTYHQVLGKTGMAGELCLLPVLEGALQQVSPPVPLGPTEPQPYHLLIAALSAVPTDLEAVRGLLPELAGLPLSVLLIGIGEEGFDTLQVLPRSPLTPPLPTLIQASWECGGECKASLVEAQQFVMPPHDTNGNGYSCLQLTPCAWLLLMPITASI